MKLTRNFTLEELACRDGTQVPDDLVGNATAICKRVQVLRDLIQSPLTVNSGYRTVSYNTRIGGASRSMHLMASALDIKSPFWTPRQLGILYQGLIDLGLVPDGGMGVYSTFIHVDLGRARRWVGK